MKPCERWTAVLLVLLALSGCGRRTVRQASGGMWPTIAPGDDVTIGPTHDIHRGDLVVVADPHSRNDTHVRRVIAVAGDTFATDRDRAIVNGREVPRCRVGPFEGTLPGYPDERVSGEVFVEFLDSAAYLVFSDASALPGASLDPPTGPFKVAPGDVMVLGDNRLNSVGSQQWGNRKGVGFAESSLLGQPLRLDATTPRLFAGASSALAAGLARCMATKASPEGSALPP